MNEERVRVFLVDAFSEKPFQGNPACVCLLKEPAETSWMQSFAEEINLSETAFLWEEGGGFRIRWFTPKVEVKLCGHATLASAHILWNTGNFAPGDMVCFHSRSGPLHLKLCSDGIEMDFPACSVEAIHLSAELRKGIGCDIRFVGKAGEDFLVELSSEDALRALSPDGSFLSQFPARAWIFTCRSSSSAFDFVSRFFAPSIGVDEDPVTGSAHCALGPYWSKKLGRDRLCAYQASKRGGSLQIRTQGERVFILGKALTIFEGELCFSPQFKTN